MSALGQKQPLGRPLTNDRFGGEADIRLAGADSGCDSIGASDTVLDKERGFSGGADNWRGAWQRKAYSVYIAE
jgi:hypothetical protein